MKIILLPTGEKVFVDDDEYDNLMTFKWHLHRSGNYNHKGKPYVARTEYIDALTPSRTVRMHRQIMGLQAGDKREVVHLDGDGLNNQRSNLEVVTHKENMARMLVRRCKKESA